MTFRVIGFDADDTLWINEPYFLETEEAFCALLGDYLGPDEVKRELFRTEMSNMKDYGYGVKAFTLSMIQTALRISDHNVSQAVISKIICMGKEMLRKPVELLDGIEDVLAELQARQYKLIVATKGDLHHQQKKLDKSGLKQYFHHIEIMGDKREDDYTRLFKRLSINPDSFLMIGNSLKSDIAPILNLGGFGIHLPYHTTWEHEIIAPDSIDSEKFKQVDTPGKILPTITVLEKIRENNRQS